MTRLSKQARRRSVSPKRPALKGTLTGPKKDNLDAGYKEHANAITNELSNQCFIPKIK